MSQRHVIVGGGAAGAAAVQGIRARDAQASIVLLSAENHPPYQRPPLSKGLWTGRTTLERIGLQGAEFFREQRVDLVLRREVVEIDPRRRKVWDDRGIPYDYDRLLLATGGRPRRLAVDGADAEGVHYFRTLEDYLTLRRHIERIQHVLVVGGGFIGVELAAALRTAGLEVTLVYPEEYPLQRIVPRDLGLALADEFRRRGVEAVSGEQIARFESRGGEILAFTPRGDQVTTQRVVVGAGIEPNTDLADAAGLAVDDGIQVDEYARTSDEGIYAAGDVAEFPYAALGLRARVEHWDHALLHGRAAGANMAGARQPYTEMPLFFSDVFDLGWEAVGEVDSRLATHAVWREEFRAGVVFYLRDEIIRGVLLWNVWGRIAWARDLIREARPCGRPEREALAAAAWSAPGAGGAKPGAA